MRLYLVQHGLARPESEDPKKGLTEKGIVQTQKTADFFRSQELQVELIWHSSKLRAVQTAQIFTQNIPAARIQERDGLNPQDPVKEIAQEIKLLGENLMIVGHLPFLQKLAAELLTHSSKYELISFKNSGIVCLEYQQDWKLLFALNPDLW